jgi:hypothetical protein
VRSAREKDAANGIPAAASITSRPASGGPPSVFSSYSSRTFRIAVQGIGLRFFLAPLSSAGDSRCAMIRITSAVTLGSRDRQATWVFNLLAAAEPALFLMQQAPRFPRAIVFRIAAMHHTITSRRQRLRPVAVRWSGSPPRPPSSGEPPAAGRRTLGMAVEDVYTQNRRLWVRLREKGGERHAMPCHHKP